MNTNTLSYFLEIAKTDSLNKAAENLYISQPALRASIANLEKELGAPLLQRTKHGSFLTDFGKKVAQEAPALLKQIEEWKMYAEKQNLSVEKICICSTMPFCNVVLTPVSASLQQQFEALNFSINSANYFDSIAMLKNKKSQIAIIHTDLTEPEILRKQLQLSNHYVIENILENCFLALINKNSDLAKKEHLYRIDFENYIYTNVSAFEMFSTTSTFLKNGFYVNTSSSFYDSHYNIFQLVNMNPSYYSLLSSIFAMTNSYQMYQNICFKPVVDLPNKNAFYLIYSLSHSSKNLSRVCDAIKEYCNMLSHAPLMEF